MLRSVFRAEIWQRRRSLAWWLGSAFVYLVFIGSVYPTIRGNAAQIDQLLENYPEVFKGMFGVGEDLLYSSPEGFLHLQVFSFVLPLVLLVFTVGFGARTIAGAEEEGTQRFSPFYYYAEEQPVRNGLDWGHSLVLAGLTALAVGASVFTFERRDVGT